MADEELFEIESGEKISFDELILRYEPLIISETSGFIYRNPELEAEAEDCRQEARLAVYDAAKSYELNDKVTFGLYAKICVHNRLISYLRKFNAAKKRTAELSEIENADSMRSGSSFTEDFVIGLDGAYRLRKVIEEKLTPYEKEVFHLYVGNKSYADIGRQLGKSRKSIDNTVSRIKSKIKKNFYGS